MTIKFVFNNFGNYDVTFVVHQLQYAGFDGKIVCYRSYTDGHSQVQVWGVT